MTARSSKPASSDDWCIIIGYEENEARDAVCIGNVERVRPLAHLSAVRGARLEVHVRAGRRGQLAGCGTAGARALIVVVVLVVLVLAFGLLGDDVVEVLELLLGEQELHELAHDDEHDELRARVRQYCTCANKQYNDANKKVAAGRLAGRRTSTGKKSEVMVISLITHLRAGMSRAVHILMIPTCMRCSQRMLPTGITRITHMITNTPIWIAVNRCTRRMPTCLFTQRT